MVCLTSRLNICLLYIHTCESYAAFTLIDILIVYILLVNKVMYKCLTSCFLLHISVLSSDLY